MAPVQHFKENTGHGIPPYIEGYNVADYLLEVASDPPVGLFDLSPQVRARGSGSEGEAAEKGRGGSNKESAEGLPVALNASTEHRVGGRPRQGYATTFLTQLQYLSGREWKILRRRANLLLTAYTRLMVRR